MAGEKRWIVTADGDSPLETLKQELTKTGFSIDQVFDEIGSISGRGGDDIAQRVRGLRGVADVSPDQPVDIGPPDAPVTW